MNSRTRLFVLLFLPFLFTLFCPSAIFAANEKIPKNVVLPQTEEVNKDYFAAGQSVTLSGTINQDAYVAGGNILIDGTINGDLLVAGGNITISGKIKNNVRVVGGQIIISGSIGGNLSLAGGSMNLTSSAVLGGSIVGVGGNLSVLAPIKRDINFVGGNVSLGNSVAGDVNAVVGQITLSPQAKINGNLTYLSSNDAAINQGAIVAGKTIHNLPPELPKPQPAKAMAVFSRAFFFLKLSSLIASILIGFLLLKYLPLFVRKTVEKISGKFGESLGIGFLVLILTPIIFVALLITIVGIPIGLIIISILAILAYLARIFVSLWVGQKIIGKEKPGWALMLGLIIVSVASAIPFIGWLVSCLSLLLGVGAIFLAKKDLYHQLRGKELI